MLSLNDNVNLFVWYLFGTANLFVCSLCTRQSICLLVVFGWYLYFINNFVLSVCFLPSDGIVISFFVCLGSYGGSEIFFVRKLCMVLIFCLSVCSLWMVLSRSWRDRVFH